MDSDVALLRAYLENRSQPAFATLVRRHLPLVYSAALRQVGGDTHLAEDVSQEVFTVLTRKAPGLRDHPVLAGWLHRTTHYVAARIRRDEQLRRRRETEAATMIGLPDAVSETDWNKLQPVIDDALLQLAERDRLAVLLRFFEDRPFAQIGQSLGLTENAARMRVDRALDALQVILAKRGIASTGAALGLAFAQQAVTATPIGLATAIAANALTTGAGGGLLLFMTTTKIKTGIIAIAIAVSGTGLFVQHRTNAGLQAEVSRLQAELQNPLRQTAETSRDATEVSILRASQAELASLRAELAELKGTPLPAAARAWVARMQNLRERMAELPEQNIPELRLLTEDDWMDVAKGTLETDADFRRAMASVRNLAEERFTPMIRAALASYLKETGQPFPRELAQLQTYFEDPQDAAMLDRYEVVAAETVGNVRVGGDWAITQRIPVDEDYDSRRVIGTVGYGGFKWNLARNDNLVTSLLRAYGDANNGREPTNLSQLKPYASTPEQEAALHEKIQQQASLEAHLPRQRKTE